MNKSKSTLAAKAITTMVILLAALPARAQWSIPRIVDPVTYSSPSGRWQFYVDPSDRYGAGPSTCRFSRDSGEIWRRKWAFTPIAARVADNGLVIACGYERITRPSDDVLSAYLGRYPIYDPNTRVDIAILDSRGNRLVDDSVKRAPTGPRSRRRRMMTALVPTVNGVICDPAGDRIIVRLTSGVESAETWRVYRLSTGRRLPDIATSKFSPVKHAVVAGAAVVEGTPLIVVHWIDNADSYFQLVDGANRVVWHISEPGALNQLMTSEFGGIMLDWLMRGSSILPTDKPAHFRLISFSKPISVGYAVSRAADGKWKVAKTPMAPFSLGDNPMNDKSWQKTPIARLKLLSTSTIPTVDSMPSNVGQQHPMPPPNQADASAIHNIFDAYVVDDGSIYVLDNTKVIHMLDFQMRSIRTFIPPASEYARGLDDLDSLSVTSSGDIYAWGRYGMPLRLHFLPDGVCREVQAVDKPENNARTDAGGHWLPNIDSVDLDNSREEVVRRISRNADGSWLRRPDVLSTAPNGDLALLDDDVSSAEIPIHVRLDIYSAAGKPVGVIVPQAWAGFGSMAFDGRRIIGASYTGIFCMDIHGKPLWRIPIDGQYQTKVYLTDHDRTLTVFTKFNQILRYALPS